MFVTFLRESKVAAYLLLIVRLYLGWTWMTAGWLKIVDGFDATNYLHAAVQATAGDHPAVQGWWANFLEGFAIPHIILFNVLIPWGEFFVGLGLIFGFLTTLSACMGIVMNFAFLFSGTTSSNPQMVLLTVFVLVAGMNAGKIGFDRWMVPYLRREAAWLLPEKPGGHTYNNIA
ncbi:DoxX family protein [Numidum massiliense]|uniref:DoxX family protein n=1 Tax=Numidum massiliense TaxID=1522315 RepID=UPI0006D54098|nr:DoxX family protein [Numidum massiliense]